MKDRKKSRIASCVAPVVFWALQFGFTHLVPRVLVPDAQTVANLPARMAQMPLPAAPKPAVEHLALASVAPKVKQRVRSLVTQVEADALVETSSPVQGEEVSGE